MRLFVANFPDEADETALRTLFENYGKVVSVKIMLDYETGKRRGFAFVSMPLDYQGARALRHLEGSDFMGRVLAVREARKGTRNRRTGRDRRRRQRASYNGPERRKGGDRRRSERRMGRPKSDSPRTDSFRKPETS